jgi:hypothetical protein
MECCGWFRGFHRHFPASAPPLRRDRRPRIELTTARQSSANSPEDQFKWKTSPAARVSFPGSTAFSAPAACFEERLRHFGCCLKDVSVVDREKIFSSRRVTPPASSGFRTVRRTARHHWPAAAILSMLFALAGLRFTLHNWHHPDDPSPWATPLVAIAILLAAWNRFRRSRR